MKSPEQKESFEKIKPKGIIAGGPGIGKTTFTENFASELSVRDMDSADYSDADNPNWKETYINDIIKNTDSYDLLLIASMPDIVQALRERDYEVTVVCPDENLREEYIERFKGRNQKRVSPENLADWGVRSRKENLENFAGGRLVFLKSGQYLSDIVDTE